MNPPIDPLSLGATLYVPATRAGLEHIVATGRHSGLRSAVICLEDAVRLHDLPGALANVAALIAKLQPGGGRPRLFIRPRDPALLAQILSMPGSEKIDGFVIPKATADSLPGFLQALEHCPQPLMPTLETREMFDPAEQRRLRRLLLPLRDRVILLRIGGNDLLQTIGVRRSRVRTIYDGPLGATIAALVTAFRPWGFHLSAPVFEHYSETALLREEVERDIEHGLLTKTAIHPLQIEIIQDMYAVSSAELAEAQAILSSESPAVFGSRGSMAEPATHRSWAETVIRRREYYGTAILAAARSVRR